jgi:hypothetical protein
MGLARACIEPSTAIAESPCLFFEGSKKRSAEAPTARLGDDVHPLDLDGLGVEALQAAAGQRSVLLVSDEEHPVGGSRLGRRSRRQLVWVELAVSLLSFRQDRGDQRARRLAVGFTSTDFNGHPDGRYSTRWSPEPRPRDGVSEAVRGVA